MESALRVFEGIELQAAIQRLESSYSGRTPSRKGRFSTKSDSQHPVTQHAACLVLEAIYLKGKSLQKLGRFKGMYVFFTIKSYALNRLEPFLHQVSYNFVLCFS